MGEAFSKKGLDSPRLMAEMLVAHVVGCDRLKLYTDPDRPASPLERQTLRDLVSRALVHEPVQYLVGEGWFFGMPFHVDRRVLIPRPATETIVQEVLQHHRSVHGSAAGKGNGLLLADVCTGSGCIVTALLKHLPAARAVASDISPDALAVAHTNAQRHGVLERLELLNGNLLEPIESHPAAGPAGSLDYLLSNPPYIPDDEWDAVLPNVKNHEPHLALRGGVSGLDYVVRLLERGPRLLKPGGMILIEVADSRAEQAKALATNAGLQSVRIVNDFEGLARVIVGMAPSA